MAISTTIQADPVRSTSDRIDLDPDRMAVIPNRNILLPQKIRVPDLPMMCSAFYYSSSTVRLLQNSCIRGNNLYRSLGGV